MTTSPDHFESMYLAAHAYAQSARLLNREAVCRNMAVFLSSQVLAALALEIYFKSIYFLEFSKDFGTSHNFHNLLKLLPSSARTELQDYFDEEMSTRDMSDIKVAEACIEEKIPHSFDQTVEIWSNVFVKARYYYEPRKKPLPMYFFDELERALLKFIQIRHPPAPSKRLSEKVREQRVA